MARTPRSSVSKTSGQGISRLSYQKGYSLGNKGSGASAGVRTEFDTPDADAGGSRNYAKGGGGKGGMNISYGETLPIGDLEDVKKLYRGKPGKSWLDLVPGKQKKMK